MIMLVLVCFIVTLDHRDCKGRHVLSLLLTYSLCRQATLFLLQKTAVHPRRFDKVNNLH